MPATIQIMIFVSRSLLQSNTYKTIILLVYWCET